MKRKVLKPAVEKMITYVTALQFVLICSLEDFELKALPFIIVVVGIFLLNIHVLIKYSSRN